MSDIELVIKIPEEVYNYIMSLKLRNMAEEYIKNGMPLEQEPMYYPQVDGITPTVVAERSDKE